MKNKIILTVSILVLSVAIIFTLFKNKKSIDEKNVLIDRSKNAVTVLTTKVQMLPVNHSLTIPAVVASKEEAVIASNSQGKIAELYFDIGTYVSKNQVIGKIDSKQKQLQLQATELTIKKLKQDYERFQDLLKGNAVSETTVLDAKYNYESTVIQSQQLRQQIADADIIAPISGIITSRKLVGGEFANIGMMIGTIVNPNQLKASVYVNEKDIIILKENKQVIISSDVYPGKTFTGIVSYISPKGDDNHNYQVDLDVNNLSGNLKAGAYIKVTFMFDNNSNALQIPKKALVDGIKNPYAYVVYNNIVKKRKLVLGREFDENIEVLKGLNMDDVVVIDGQINLMDGSMIEITK